MLVLMDGMVRCRCAMHLGHERERRAASPGGSCGPDGQTPVNIVNNSRPRCAAINVLNILQASNTVAYLPRLSRYIDHVEHNRSVR